jgi:hypothetical protein
VIVSNFSSVADFLSRQSHDLRPGGITASKGEGMPSDFYGIVESSSDAIEIVSVIGCYCVCVYSCGKNREICVGQDGGRDISAASVALAKRNVNEIVAPVL